MPDRYRFDQLGDSVRCIDCPTGGPIWHPPEPKRQQHARTHGTAPKPKSIERWRQGSLLAPPPPASDEEKEATMATTPNKGDSAKQVAIDILREAGGPLHAKEIAKRVLASGRCTSLKGKTPEATITAMLAVGSKSGGPFARVDKGTYTLTDTATAATPTKTAAQQRTRPGIAASTRATRSGRPNKYSAATRSR